MIAADDIGMLALPAETGGLRQRLFHHRCGIDKDLHLAFGLSDQPSGGALERPLHHVMIILALRIDRNAAVIGDVFQRKRIGGGGVAHAKHDHRLHVRPQGRRIGSLVGAVRHPDHVALPALGEPLPQPLPGLGRQCRRCYADGRKPLFHRLFFKRFGQS